MGEVDDLLEASWAGRGRPVRGRELKLELAVTAAFLAAVAALVLVPGELSAPHPAAWAVVLGYALAGRVQFPIGSVVFVPTQLFLVPLFVLAPAQLVPALVFVALALAALGAAARRQARLSRIVFCAGDATYSLGPALVILLLAEGDAATATAAVIALAFAAQLATDFAASSLHELLAMGVKPEVHLRALQQIWAVDASLTTVGLLAAEAALTTPWAALSPMPFVVLLRFMAADRTRKIDAAHDRLQALQRERGRLRAAVRRVGDAFASNQDLAAVLRTVTAAAAEALEGAAARASVVRDGALADRIEVRGEPTAAALQAAEGGLLAGASAIASAECEGWHALAGRVGTAREPLGVVVIARGRVFSDDERQLLGHLCEQATVSAANARRHEVLLEAEAQMRHRAFHDPLTGLANRAQFGDRVEHALQRRGRKPASAAVLFIDLDGFKLVNDTLGHETGDELLVVVAGRLLGCLRDGDTAARFGGDEFAVLLEGLDDRVTAPAIAERVRHALSAPVVLGSREFVVRGSIGLAHAAPGLDRDDVLRRADLAMYAAKRAGGGRTVHFHAEMLEEARTRVELAQDLRGAAGRGEFDLCFQPVVDLERGTISVAEALVRWRHPRRGLLAPSEFVPVAEETGVIRELGLFVLDGACRAAAGWPDAAVSVNVSAGQLRDAGFAGAVEAVLRRHGLPAERLVLEVTESVVVDADPATQANVEALRHMGVTLALDDFGTGYSSLSSLARLPFDVVKLDRSFLAQVDEAPAQSRLVAGVVGLGRSLGLRVVAEGIERPGQLEHLQELGVELGQGHLLGVPVSAGELAARLRAEAGDGPRLRLVS